MGRKSSAKAQATPDSAPPPPPPEPRRSFTALLIVVIAAVAIIGVFAYVRAGQQTETDQRAQAAPAPAVVDPPASAALGPHPQENLPPLPFDPAPARPAQVVRAAYKFAAEHPEVLSYVPCYCGCERSGHRGNEDCFVTARNANGDVTEWEPHGMT